MNRRTFLKLTAISTVGLPTLPIMAKQKPRWIPLVRTLPKVGQRIALVLSSLEKKSIIHHEMTIHIGKVITTCHRPPPTYQPRISLEEEMRYQNYDGNGIFPKKGYCLWYKRNLPYNAIEQCKKMKCLKTIVWWGGEHNLGTVYVWNYRNGEPSFKWWAPIDQIPETLPPFPKYIAPWIPFSKQLPIENEKIKIKDQGGEVAEGKMVLLTNMETQEKIKYFLYRLKNGQKRFKNTPKGVFINNLTTVNEKYWSWRYA